MSYQVERDTFISQATREGLSVEVCRKLLRYATTLQRLSEAQCNGDWPYNGDRDRPQAKRQGMACPWCSAGNEPRTGSCECDEAGTVWKWTRDEAADKRHDSRYTTCPKCEVSGVSKSAMKASTDRGLRLGKTPTRVCPDCRTQELVNELLDTLPKGRVWECIPCMHTWFAEVRLSEHTGRLSGEATEYCPVCVKRAGFGSEVRPLAVAHFNGDPRGAVLVLSTPNYPWTDDGRGRGLYVPAGKGR